MKEYKLAHGYDAFSLESSVLNWLSQGFILHGNPFTNNGLIYQAMTRNV